MAEAEPSDFFGSSPWRDCFSCELQIPRTRPNELARCSGGGKRALFLVLGSYTPTPVRALGAQCIRRAQSTNHENSETPKPKLRNLPSEVRYRPKLRNSETETPKLTETNTQDCDQPRWDSRWDCRWGCDTDPMGLRYSPDGTAIQPRWDCDTQTQVGGWRGWWIAGWAVWS